MKISIEYMPLETALRLYLRLALIRHQQDFQRVSCSSAE
jgi:hypothetical protein